MSDDKNTNPPFGNVEVCFDVDVKTHISLDFDDLYYVEDGRFDGDIMEAEEVLRGLVKKAKDLKTAIAYAKKERDRIASIRREHDI